MQSALSKVTDGSDAIDRFSSTTRVRPERSANSASDNWLEQRMSPSTC